MERIVLFNKESGCPWQTYEDTQVMVSNRKGGDVFCKAIDVELGDNVWEHNIVTSKTILSNKLDKIKFHYGQKMR